MKHSLHIPLILLFFLICSVNGKAQQLLSTNEQLDLAVQLINQGTQPEEVIVSLEPILFDENQTELNSAQKSYLSKLATYLKKTPWSLEISGHSDKEESNQFNEKLAKERADNVENTLLSNGVLPTRVTSNAYGDTKAASLSADQRFRNRRAELQLSQKSIEVDLQDLIILNNEETLGGVVLNKNTDFVFYKNYADNKFYKVRKSEIKEVVLENGEVWEFENQEEKITNESPKEIKRRKKERLNDFDKLKVLGTGFSLKNLKIGFSEPKLFSTGAFVVYAGGNVQTSLGKDAKHRESSVVVPPTSFGMEVGIFKNIGIGIVGGMDYWREKPFEYDYQHYTLGARLAWHFKMPNNLNKVDPYVGGAATYHWLFFENDPELCASGFHPPDNRFSLVNTKWAFDAFAGIRYYWGKRWGLYGEIGSDGLSNYEFGIQYLVAKPKRKEL